jgi:peptidoglycan/LPS O-acetylase OafA/YrhL
VSSRTYWPQLDGVRALAISAVIAYHLGYLPGGWIGVDIFFVLSGYLITTILLSRRETLAGLKGFWGSRAKRLLPAVLLLLLALSIYAWVGAPGLVPAQLRPPALATLFYTANWQEILSGHSYFASFTAPSPLQHMWSLAVEEEYYLIWPLLLGVLLLATRSWRGQRRALVAGTLLLAIASAVWMGVAAHLYGGNRAYLGTDTRAWELLIGGAAAMLWPPGQRASRGRRWSVLAALGVLGVVLAAWWLSGPPAWVWDGGLVGVGVCGALIIVGAVRAPEGPVGTFLTLRPVRWLGLISYSLYLWHWPVIVLMTEDNTGLSGPWLLGARLLVMLGAACGSYYLVERPLRRADWGRLKQRLHVPAASFAGIGLCLTAAVIVGGTVGPQQAASATVFLSGLTAPAPATGAAQLNLPPASPGHPYRVWLLGDSVMADASLGVQAALQATGDVKVVLNSAFPAWSLSRDPSWPSEFRQNIATYRPQIIMGTWSWDDDEASQAPHRYLGLLESALHTLLRPGDGVEAVVLLQFPQTGPAPSVTNVSARQKAFAHETLIQDDWDSAARQATSAFPGHALYLTTSDLFAPAGRYVAWFRTPNATWIRARKLDNVHFCPYGAAEFGALVTERLTPQLHLPPMGPDWEFGAWIHDHRYNAPSGACPADQPPPDYHGQPVPTVSPVRFH